jgi:hypothetical protein
VTFKWTLPGIRSTLTGSRVTYKPTTRGVKQLVLTISDSTKATTTVTYAVRVVDTKKPSVKLRRVKTVRLGKSSTLAGVALDPGGLKSVTLHFGDSRKVTVHVHKDGSFTVKHRYRRAKTYKATLTAIDKVGHVAHTTAKVRIRR